MKNMKNSILWLVILLVITAGILPISAQNSAWKTDESNIIGGTNYHTVNFVINNETFLNVPIYTPKDMFGNYISMLADIGIINRHFNRRKTVRKSLKRWLGLHLGIKGIIVSTILLDKKLFIGFSNYHTEQTFLKSVFDELWEKEPDVLKAACTRFREDNTVNNYIFRYFYI